MGEAYREVAQVKLTKKKALELTAELWDWVSENGKRKHEWPGWDTKEAQGDCFLCEYDSQHVIGDRECKKCPLYGKWNGHRKCDTKGSPYHTWYDIRDGSLPEARLAAKQVADLCREELRRLENK